MQANHSIDVDVENGFVRYTLSGFFDEVSLASLRAERAAKLPRLKTQPNQHITLCDVSQCTIQSQESLAALRVMLAHPTWQARRLAFVVGGGLARMQVRRVVSDLPNVQWFADTTSAEAWLLAD